jgi:hypothetical protein
VNARSRGGGGLENITVGLKNALPFVGFGFLDNLIMILAVCVTWKRLLYCIV